MTISDITELVQDKLKGNAEINARLSGGIFVSKVPESAQAPYCFLTTVSNVPFDEPLDAPSSTWDATIQISLVTRGEPFTRLTLKAIQSVFEALDIDGVNVTVTSVIPQLQNDNGKLLSVVELQITYNS